LRNLLELLELKPDAKLVRSKAWRRRLAAVYAKEALVELDLKLLFLKIRSLPGSRKLILELLEKTVDTVLVFEELEAVVEEQ